MPLQTMSTDRRGSRAGPCSRAPRSHPGASRTGCGEVDLLLLLVPLEHREIDDPAERELVLVDEAELAAGAVARLTGEGGELVRPTADEEHGVARFEPELGADRLGALDADVLGDRAGTALLALTPEDVAEARLGPRPGPTRSCGRRSAAAAVLAGIAHTSTFGTDAIWLANTLKPRPAKCSVTACISIGLRRSGLSSRICASTPNRECAGRSG